MGTTLTAAVVVRHAATDDTAARSPRRTAFIAICVGYSFIKMYFTFTPPSNGVPPSHFFCFLFLKPPTHENSVKGSYSASEFPAHRYVFERAEKEKLRPLGTE